MLSLHSSIALRHGCNGFGYGSLLRQACRHECHRGSQFNHMTLQVFSVLFLHLYTYTSILWRGLPAVASGEVWYCSSTLSLYSSPTPVRVSNGNFPSSTSGLEMTAACTSLTVPTTRRIAARITPNTSNARALLRRSASGRADEWRTFSTCPLCQGQERQHETSYQ